MFQPRTRCARSSSRSAALYTAVRSTCEQLEARRLLTSTLYLDWGDNFPVGGLQMTVETLRESFGSDGLQGPDLRQPDDGTTAGINEQITDATLLAFAPTAPLVTFDYNTDGLTNNADYIDLQANVLTLVQRYYQPFDINVVMAPAVDNTSSATYIDGVRSQLQLGANTDGEYDGWIFLTNMTRIGDAASIGFLTGNFGVSNGGDIDSNNAADNAGLVYTDRVFNASTNTDIDTRLAYTAAHEAGHDFGLRHTNNGFGTGGTSASGNAQTDADMILLTGSNLVTGSAAGAVRTSTVMVTRFPLVRGDNNSVAGGGFDITDTRVPYDQLANGNNLGLRAGAPAYVTGTGAFDLITLTPGAPGFANVAVEAHRDATFANQIGATYSYSVPLTNGILIDAGRSADRIVIDATLNTSITLRGMAGDDQLVADGNGLASATYTPGSASQVLIDDTTSFTAQLNFAGGANISLEEFEPNGSVTVQDVGTLTLVTPNGADNLTLSAPSAGLMRIAGTSDSVALVPLQFNGVADLVIDTGTNDGGSANDTVLIAASSVATGLNTITINTGAGGDLLDVNFAPGNPIPAGGLSFNAGAGVHPDDLLNLRGGSFATEVYTPGGPNSGTIVLGGSSTITYSNLAPINDTVTVTDFTFNASAGADVINLIDSGVFNSTDTTQINSGNGTFERVNFGNKTNVDIQGQNGADIFNVSLADPADGMSTLALFGEDLINAGDDNANDRFNITPQAGSLAIFVSGGGDSAGSGDVLAVNGSGGDFVVSNTTFTAAGVQTIQYTTLERLELTAGTFEVGGVVNTPFHVNNAATLIGTGTAAGGITVNTGGTVAPGIAGPGILGSGNLLFTDGNYTVDINGTTPGTLHDQLNVTGTVNLGAGVATLNAAVGYASVPGDEIVIIRNDGADPVVGFFDGAPQGAIFDFGGGQKFTIDYGFEADGDGNFNDVALIRYGAALAEDPCDPTKLALFVSATAGDDVIELIGNKGNPRVRVLINGVDEGTFMPTGGIYAMAQNGNDLLTAAGIPSRDVVLYGNAGDDQLEGGNNHSILIGGWGDDLLRSGNGKDLLIGGRGADTLYGGTGTDILIAGYTDHDVTTNAARMVLCEIRDAWHRGGKAASVSAFLNAGTMHDDADADQLFGGQGKDWLVMNSLGGSVLDASDASGPDLITDLV